MKTQRAKLEPQLYLEFLHSLRYIQTQFNTGTSGGTIKTCPEHSQGLAASVQAFLGGVLQDHLWVPPPHRTHSPQELRTWEKDAVTCFGTTVL